MTTDGVEVGDRIDERIAARHDRLTPQEQRAAATLLEHLDDLATYRAAELAELAGVSKATMSRLFRSLGFEDFDQVREHLRGLRSTGEPRRADGAVDPAAIACVEQAAVQRAVEHPRTEEAITLIAEARRVVVVGWRNSYPVALHLREQLAQARDEVRIAPAPGQTLGEELTGLGRQDLVVVIGFRRRPAGFAAFLAEARSCAATVLLVGDPSAVSHAAHVDLWLECPLTSALAFDSYAAPMALVSVLADGVLARLGRAGSNRVRSITAAYERLDETE
ncbi:MurR/RpiR family transcriptional regulator [Nocardioides sambongensis]|uniref:MurR/RpiR family transcriptional regulator n=1 Tax=Nocardioides sambongensis TaxID=2589074 RepID=UPI00112E9EC5|nr:MurR/RpiR family transcriptional regulator [Nocardioides sambongensis]